MMETRARYLVIGAFVLACIFAVFGFVYWLQNSGGLGRAIYRVQFDQPVPGLVPGSSVLFNGIRVGVILNLQLDPNNPKRVMASIAIDPGTPVRTDTQVDVSFQGLTGTPTISLKGGLIDAPALASPNGQPPLLVAVADAGKNLTESARETLHRLDVILDDNAAPLHTAITGISKFADMLGHNSERIENLIGGLEKLAGVGKKETPAVYDLVAPTKFPPLAREIKDQVTVPDPAATLVFDTQNILIRTASGTFSTVENAKWADNLPKLMQAKIVQSFENAQQLRAVSRPLDQLEAKYRLELGIRNFQISLEPQPTAVVEFSARLVSDKGNVANARIFNVSVPAEGTQGPQAAAALNQAFSKSAIDLVAWVVGLI
jgi:phospholipid/cholesterol/gamma-HCH transport system substrate-binding protein